MGLFGALVRTAINVVTLPVTGTVAITKDICTLGGTLTHEDESYTKRLIEQIKDDADED